MSSQNKQNNVVDKVFFGQLRMVTAGGLFCKYSQKIAAKELIIVVSRVHKNNDFWFPCFNILTSKGVVTTTMEEIYQHTIDVFVGDT